MVNQIFWLTEYLINFAAVFRGVAQLASALAWGARGRLFESDHPDSEVASKEAASLCLIKTRLILSS
jgi:hypothetical protein